MMSKQLHQFQQPAEEESRVFKSVSEENTHFSDNAFSISKSVFQHGSSVFPFGSDTKESTRILNEAEKIWQQFGTPEKIRKTWVDARQKRQADALLPEADLRFNMPYYIAMQHATKMVDLSKGHTPILKQLRHGKER